MPFYFRKECPLNSGYLKRYTQRIERHNLNLRQHLARLGRKSLSFSKSVELHDKVIGHYLNIKHYQ
ncbi:putative transposase [Shigella flexneri K-227]|uniref:Putative transposase n=1 Tax=Shigella flexneri K-227 TaxID=766147 RepID=F5NVM5_SHIFL|nr:putative transposase [Shigella flexneri K-227]EGK38899.1 putative transposase [Shigella flexneri K-227]